MIDGRQCHHPRQSTTRTGGPRPSPLGKPLPPSLKRRETHLSGSGGSCRDLIHPFFFHAAAPFIIRGKASCLGLAALEGIGGGGRRREPGAWLEVGCQAVSRQAVVDEDRRYPADRAAPAADSRTPRDSPFRSRSMYRHPQYL